MLANLNAKMTNLSAKIANLSAKIANSSAKIANLSAKMANLDAKMANLGAIVEPSWDKKCHFVRGGHFRTSAILIKIAPKIHQTCWHVPRNGAQVCSKSRQASRLSRQESPLACQDDEFGRHLGSKSGHFRVRGARFHNSVNFLENRTQNAKKCTRVTPRSR